MTTKIHLQKVHGAGNDFLFLRLPSAGVQESWSGETFFTKRLFDQTPLGLESVRMMAQTLCHRTMGLGADGLVFWQAPSDAQQHATMLIVNSDGSLAGTCGNALRCLGLLSFRHQTWKGDAPLQVKRLHNTPQISLDSSKLSEDEHFATVETPFAEILSLNQTTVLIGMGKEFSANVIEIKKDFKEHILKDFPLLSGFPILSVYVELANPHWVFLSQGFETFDSLAHIAFGKLCQKEYRSLIAEEIPLANIGMTFHSTTNSNPSKDCDFQLTVYERGAGLTSCCGSGATAARIALEKLNMDEKKARTLRFRMPGGTVEIGKTATQWTLSGPAVHVADIAVCHLL